MFNQSEENGLLAKGERRANGVGIRDRDSLIRKGPTSRSDYYTAAADSSKTTPLGVEGHRRQFTINHNYSALFSSSLKQTPDKHAKGQRNKLPARIASYYGRNIR